MINNTIRPIKFLNTQEHSSTNFAVIIKCLIYETRVKWTEKLYLIKKLIYMNMLNLTSSTLL